MKNERSVGRPKKGGKNYDSDIAKRLRKVVEKYINK